MKNWEVKKLGDVCSFFNGQAHEKCIDENGKYKLINSKFVSSEGENFKRTNNALSPLFVNDIVMVMSDVPNGKTLAKCFVVDKDDTYTLNQRICVIRSKNFDTRFLYYQLNRNKYLLSFDNGENQSNLRKDDILNCELFVPPLPEQKRIVATLDEAFAALAKAKANAEQNLKNAKELFESYLQGVFENKGEDWEEKTLEQVSKIFGRGKSRHRPRNYEKLYGGIYPFIQTGDIRNCNHYITEFSQTYSELGLAQSKLWPSGTICITIAANIAETGVLTFDACFPDSVIGLVVDEKFADRDFIEYLLQSFKARIQALGKGSAQANINMGTFENELFPFPSVAEQKAIVQKLDTLSAETKKLEAIYQKKISDLEELKKSVLQKAFSGKLKIAKEITV
jgi:type I restriction enzyme S subunit